MAANQGKIDTTLAQLPRADPRAVADVDRAQNGSVRPDHDVIPNRRVALSGTQTRASEGNALVQRHVVADLGRRADQDAHAVIDEEPAPDGGRRVDLDTGRKAHDVRKKTRQQRNAHAIEKVDDAVRGDRVEPGIRQNDIERTACCRIFFDRNAHVFEDVR